jgi:VWA domain-containing protein
MRVTVLPLVLTLAAALALQAASNTAELQTGASRVALATVADPRNRPLLDVGPDDFVIQEAGAAREVLSVRPADYPIVVLIDNGADARADFQQMRKAVAHFLERIGDRPIALGTFGNLPKMVTTFEDDRATVMRRLDELEAATSAGSLLLQGAALAARTIQSAGSLFSAMVILSATGVDSSRNAPEEMIAPIVDSQAILHVIANRTVQVSGGGAFRPGQALRALADQTRGQYTTIYSSASYQAALDRLADRLTSELMIEYLVPVGSKPNDVKVGIRLAGAHVRGLGVAPR